MWWRSRSTVLLEQVIRLQERRASLERESAAAQTTIRWLQQHVNRLEIDLAAFRQRLLQVSAHAPRLDRIDIGALGASGGEPARPGRFEPDEEVDTGRDPAQAAAQERARTLLNQGPEAIDALFSDLGDARAHANGIAWNPDGTIADGPFEDVLTPTSE
jgi:hypothetical protein